MSQTEDYLDSLLNQVTKKEAPAEPAKEAEAETAPEKELSKEDSFLKGLGGFFKHIGEKPVIREPLSETDFITNFEEELHSGNADAFIEAFENEIDEEERIFEETGEVSESEALVAALIDDRAPEDAAAKIGAAIKETQDSQESLAEDEGLDIDNLMSNTEDLIAGIQEDSADLAEDEPALDEDDLGLPDLSELEGASDAQMDELTEGLSDSEDSLDDL
ncbi:MAG: hypothetical protein HUJ98_09085, partial [Bacteroidaceae bacterium]|nr:hypothetical protein [Bacteroidaceae bacterium]